MATLHVELNPRNTEAAEGLARRTGKTPEQLVNDVFERFAVEAMGELAGAVPNWKAAWRHAAGMWKDREDIPALMSQLRREWDRTNTESEPPR